MAEAFHFRVATAIIMALFLVTSGTLIYNLLEDWDYVDSLYFTSMTLTTIGYGDLVPTHPLSKLFTVFFAFAGVGTFLFSFAVIGDFYYQRHLVRVERRLVNATQRFRKHPKESSGRTRSK